MKNEAAKLGSCLRAARTAANMSLRDVESVTGISNPYLSQLEGGKVRNPSPTVLHALADVYRISYAELMRLAGYPVPDSTDQPRAARFASRVGQMSDDEEQAVMDYLAFLRSRGRGEAR
jgi:HTH-type transcriptional regulator, competence development regulator